MGNVFLAGGGGYFKSKTMPRPLQKKKLSKDFCSFPKNTKKFIKIFDLIKIIILLLIIIQ